MESISMRFALITRLEGTEIMLKRI